MQERQKVFFTRLTRKCIYSRRYHKKLPSNLQTHWSIPSKEITTYLKEPLFEESLGPWRSFWKSFAHPFSSRPPHTWYDSCLLQGWWYQNKALKSTLGFSIIWNYGHLCRFYRKFIIFQWKNNHDMNWYMICIYHTTDM